MIEIKINNLFVVQNQIERLSRGLDDNRYLLMRRLAGTMHKAVMTNFRQGGRPKWLGLKYRDGKPLSDTGMLRQSIAEFYDKDTALVGTNMEYAVPYCFLKAKKKHKKTPPLFPSKRLRAIVVLLPYI